MTSAESALVHRLLDAVLREDVWGWRTEGRLIDGHWLHAPRGDLAVRVRPGCVSDWTVVEPVLADAGVTVSGLDAVLGRLERLVDPVDAEGFASWRQECAAALTADEALPARRSVARTRGERPAYDTDPYAATLPLESAAAHLGHPVYPTGTARLGLSADEVDRYGPESLARFALRWLRVPAGDVQGTLKDVPTWWPSSDPGHLHLPVHPLMAPRLGDLAGSLLPAEEVEVVATLSMRTVSVCADPRYALKLPLPTASLGARNVRSIKPGSLVDGAVGERLVRALVADDPRWSSLILHADEQTYAHLGRADAAVLIRRLPDVPTGTTVTPLAALPASRFDSELVVEGLARELGCTAHEVFARVCGLVVGLATWLYERGVALEAHQQNIALVTSQGQPMRLLLKDNDGLRVLPGRLPVALQGCVDDFDDGRIVVDRAGPLRDLFVTISVHLVAGQLAVALADAGVADRVQLLRTVRDALSGAIDVVDDPDIAQELRRDVLDARRWPVKAMVTAGTLLSKERSGASDINKCYVDGPNYLRTV
ncbi:IucA/IucC family protein [Luteipulveratus mongoliensis]|uniref:Siderophore biosynthesis protein n=1 Tax=Luteipulveratus mongoliensis TaxID=571913 RepID=A0A0K1JNG4_9MICO|nr:IucA/IucC family protein [Luteipulveratus mongoliensis]AKU18236.1 hypothetical protein VV02_24245 [Luteipulveratus mongoliensis]